MVSISINYEEVKHRLAENGFYIYRDEHTIQLAEVARKEYFDWFNTIPLRSGGFAYEELASGPIRKKNISSFNGLGEAYAQVMQTMYYPPSFEHGAISEVFELIVELRNRMTSMPADFGDNPKRDGYWNAKRVHHYPQGGGFMVGHSDTYFNKVLGDQGFLQILFLMSEKGRDFMSGGGFVEDLNGTRIDAEEVGGMGTIIFFNGEIMHGVADVDPLSDFSFESPTGRLAAIANLYEYRSPDAGGQK
jgi:hypothetical protein